MKVGRKREATEYRTNTRNENQEPSYDNTRYEGLPQSFFTGSSMKDDIDILESLRNAVKRKIGSEANIGDIILEETEEE